MREEVCHKTTKNLYTTKFNMCIRSIQNIKQFSVSSNLSIIYHLGCTENIFLCITINILHEFYRNAFEYFSLDSTLKSEGSISGQWYT